MDYKLIYGLFLFTDMHKLFQLSVDDPRSKRYYDDEHIGLITNNGSSYIHSKELVLTTYYFSRC